MKTQNQTHTHTHTQYLCYLFEGSLGVSGYEQVICLFQIGHLHVNMEPGDGSLWAQTPLQLLC